METLNILVILLIGVIITLYKGIKIVPQGEEWVIEKLGKFSKTLTPGLNLIIPFVDDVRAKISTRDIIMDIPQQEVITRDNAVIRTNAIAFVRVTNPKDAQYGVENFKLAISSLIMTTLRSIIGEMALDEALSNRETIKAKLKEPFIKRAKKAEFTACNVSLIQGEYYVDFKKKKVGTSAILTNMLGHVALLVTSEDDTSREIGDEVTVLLLD